jgi:glycosyltransferase involved in cell wall biosynthesis
MIITPYLSFIIPAFNEKNFISNTLKQLHNFAPKCPYEVIIVDNGSTDNTREIAQSFNDTVLTCPEGTIAAVRNHGVSKSKGNILVFLDADVELTLEWQNNITGVINQIIEEQLLITGSRCLAPETSNIINNSWFNILSISTSNNYINSGHLITSKVLFDEISGFNETLKTAEDHDFCVRAKQAGAKIRPTPSLKVIHYGYPATIGEFIKRERWHGREDFKTIDSTFKSKIALITLFHLCLLSLTLIQIISTGLLQGIIFYILSMILITIPLTLYKFKELKLESIIKTSLMHYFYIIGRTLSFFDRITLRYSKKFR